MQTCCSNDVARKTLIKLEPLCQISITKRCLSSLEQPFLHFLGGLALCISCAARVWHWCCISKPDWVRGWLTAQSLSTTACVNDDWMLEAEIWWWLSANNITIFSSVNRSRCRRQFLYICEFTMPSRQRLIFVDTCVSFTLSNDSNPSTTPERTTSPVCCSQCMKVRHFMFKPCQHTCCRDCVMKIKSSLVCPFCDMPISEKFVRLFGSRFDEFRNVALQPL